MDPAALRDNLLYVAAIYDGAVYVYTYPKGHLVGTLRGFYEPFGECTDAAGDVFVVTLASASSTSSTIYEYAHGSTAPIATLDDPSFATGCAVDPQTGDLAASGEAVAIFQHASGNATLYTSSEFGFYFCGYDDWGNLYLSATNHKYGNQAQLVRLAKGSDEFDQISVKPTLYMGNTVPSVQWDGKHMAISSDVSREPITVYRLRISGNKATVIGSATLSSTKNYYEGQLWIARKTIVGMGGAKGSKTSAFSWPYPTGGVPGSAIKVAGHHLTVWGVAVSPSGT